jgi:alkylation response protein AidB-like acyl-CoA dehydrogenase
VNEEQQMLRQSARDFLQTECDKAMLRRLEASDSGHSPELWKKMAELGWMGIAVPEELGGAGWSLLGLALLFEEIGGAAFDSPLLGHTLGTLLLLEGGDGEQQRTLLPGAARGERILSVAFAELEVSNDPRFVSLAARPVDGGYALSGSKLFVPYAGVADEILVAVRSAGSPGDERGITLLRVDRLAEGLRCSPLETIGMDRQFRVDFDRVVVPADRVVGEPGGGLPLLRSMLRMAAALECAEMVGGAEHELAMSADYTRERIQFDRPIGTFQAVQHHLANMFIDVQGARWTTYQAVCRLSEGRPAAREIAIAKAFTSDACQRVAFLAQQLHGGAGVDTGHDLHFYYRRAKALELNGGSAPIHLAALEKEIGL